MFVFSQQRASIMISLDSVFPIAGRYAMPAQLRVDQLARCFMTPNRGSSQVIGVAALKNRE